jgi:serine/threonine-protein kinase
VTIDLEELKREWAQTKLRVERLELASAGRQSRGVLRATQLRIWAAQVVWVVLVISSAAFWSSHLDVPHLVVAGMALHVYGVVAIVLGGIQLRAIAAIDYGEPVVELQRRLAKLIRLRARCSLALGLPWWVLWLPCMIVGFTALTGVDFYDPLWAVLSILIGIVGLGITIVIARHIAARTPPDRGLNRMIDELAGRSLVRAAREVDEVARFATE